MYKVLYCVFSLKNIEKEVKKICKSSAEFLPSSDSYTNAELMKVSNLKLGVTFSHSVGPATHRALGHRHHQEILPPARRHGLSKTGCERNPGSAEG